MFSLFLFGCKKDIFDYRNKFVDEYDFVYSSNCAFSEGGEAYSETSIYSEGSICLAKDLDSILVVNFASSSTVEVFVSKNGDLYYPNRGSSLVSDNVIGKIDKDKISLNYSTFDAGLQDADCDYVITGEED